MLLISECAFFVGTLSSNFGGIIYELMQNNHVDASWRIRSLDTNFGYLKQYERVVMIEHEPEQDDEIELKKDDVIYNDWAHRRIGVLTIPRNNETHILNRYSFGVNKRTGKQGFFPTFKTKVLMWT